MEGHQVRVNDGSLALCVYNMTKGDTVKHLEEQVAKDLGHSIFVLYRQNRERIYLSPEEPVGINWPNLYIETPFATYRHNGKFTVSLDDNRVNVEQHQTFGEFCGSRKIFIMFRGRKFYPGPSTLMNTFDSWTKFETEKQIFVKVIMNDVEHDIQVLDTDAVRSIFNHIAKKLKHSYFLMYDDKENFIDTLDVPIGASRKFHVRQIADITVLHNDKVVRTFKVNPSDKIQAVDDTMEQFLGHSFFNLYIDENCEPDFSANIGMVRTFYIKFHTVKVSYRGVALIDLTSDMLYRVAFKAIQNVLGHDRFHYNLHDSTITLLSDMEKLAEECIWSILRTKE